MLSFAMQKLTSLIRAHVWISSICLFLLLFLLFWETDLRKHWFMSENVLSVFSTKSFVVYSFVFNSFSHFESFFACGVKLCSNFIDLRMAVQLSQYHLLKRLYFPHCVFLPPLSKIIHRYVSLFLGSILFHWQKEDRERKKW